MPGIIQWLQKHTFKVHVAAFLLMTLPPVPLYWAAQANNTGLILPLLGLVIFGNALLLAVR